MVDFQKQISIVILVLTLYNLTKYLNFHKPITHKEYNLSCLLPRKTAYIGTELNIYNTNICNVCASVHVIHMTCVCVYILHVCRLICNKPSWFTGGLSVNHEGFWKLTILLNSEPCSKILTKVSPCY